VTITKADIEAKAREITQVVNETKESAQSTAILAGVGVLVAVGVAYLLGRRKARAGKAVVEVYRI
jgi:hypothetical protein